VRYLEVYWKRTSIFRIGLLVEDFNSVIGGGLEANVLILKSLKHGMSVYAFTILLLEMQGG